MTSGDDSKKIKAIIKLHYFCNNKCRFCRALPLIRVKSKLSTAEAVRKIVRASTLNVKTIMFSGGEPTLRRDLFKLINVAQRLGMGFSLITNGRMLAYPSYFKRLTQKNIEYIHTSILGADEKTHNMLTRADSFRDLLRALKNIKEYGKSELVVNTVITSHNIGQLRDMADVLAEFMPLTYKLSLLEPADIEDIDELIVAPGEAAQAAIDSINYAVSKYGDKGMRVGVEGFPLCLIQGYESYIENMMTNQILYISEVYERDFYPVDHGLRQYFRPCHYCSKKLYCPGQYPAYGGRDLVPINQDVPAVYPMILKQTNNQSLQPVAGEDCPVFRWIKSNNMDVRNGIALVTSKKIRYFRYEEGRADGLIVQRLKETEQIYLDVQKDKNVRKLSTMVPLQLDKECRDCRIAFACTGAYIPVASRGYEKRFDLQVIKTLSGISGKVADIGCARSFYTPVMLQMAKDGQIDYIGIDPGGPVDFPEVEGYMFSIIQQQPEDVDLGEKSVDWVTLLDSINDLEDPYGVLKKAYSWLIVGGGIVVLDKAPFLLLEEEPLKGWNAGKRKRNLDINEVGRWLEEIGFIIELVVPPKGGKSNIWYLVARKTTLAGQIPAVSVK